MKLRIAFSALLALVALALTAREAVQPTLLAKADQAAMESWVDQTIVSMSPRERVA